MTSQERETAAEVPSSPVLEIVLDAEGRGSVNGRRIVADDQDSARVELLDEATRLAAELGRPVRVRALDPDGMWHLAAYPNGEVTFLLPPDRPTAPDTVDRSSADSPGPDGEWRLRIHPDGELTLADQDPDDEDPDPTGPDAALILESWTRRRQEAGADPGKATEPPLREIEAAPAHRPLALASTGAAPSSTDPAPSSTAVARSEPAASASADLLLDLDDLDALAVRGTVPVTTLDLDRQASGRHTVTTRPQAALEHSNRMLVELRSSGGDQPGRGPAGPRWVVPAAAVGVILLAVGGWVFFPRDEPTERAAGRVVPSGSASAPVGPTTVGSSLAAPPTLTGTPTALEVATPPGFARRPTWWLPVSASAAPVVSADGVILTLTADHQVAQLEPTTGAVLWHVMAPATATGPHLTTIDRTRVVAVTTPTSLLYWPLPATPSAGVTLPAPTTVELTAGSSVSWAGPSPLLTLADGGTAVIRSGTVQRVTLPTSLRPLAADGTDVLAASGSTWIRQTGGQGPGTPKTLALPPGVTATTPLAVQTVGGSYLAAAWNSPEGPIVAAYDARSGALLGQVAAPGVTDFANARTVREVGTERTVFGPVLLDPHAARLSLLKATYTPVALTHDHVYVNETTNTVVDLRLSGATIDPIPFEGKNPTVPLGVVTRGTQSFAIVVAAAGSGWALCGLPAT